MKKDKLDEAIDNAVLDFNRELKKKLEKERISQIRREAGRKGGKRTQEIWARERERQELRAKDEAKLAEYKKLVPEWLKKLRANEMSIEEVPIEFDLRNKIYKKLEDEKRDLGLYVEILKAEHGPMPWDDGYKIPDDDEEEDK